MAKNNSIEITKATYLNGYKLSIGFTDGKEKVVDFGNFLSTNNKPVLEKYKSLVNFKKFKIVNGNLTWGRNWDLIFPIHDLYKGIIK